MHKKHTPHRQDGFAKYRARHYRGARHTLLLLPPAKRRALQRNLIFIGLTLGFILLVAVFSKVYAAGGAYTVDDGAVNDPGECNVDAWYTANRHQGNLHNETLNPACTFSALPSVQWSAALSRASNAGNAETQVSPQVKAQVWAREDLGLQLAVSGTSHFALDRHHAFDGADLNIPLTWQPMQALRLNLNGGWTHAYNGGEQNHRLTWGTGFEYQLMDALTLIGERYGQKGGEQAWQAGPRFHLGKLIDVDVVAGQSLTGDRNQWLTTGATVRF
ncbi:hypothetical protein HX787_01100 [Pseudomonas tolaasii]|uniref:Uncharacterized protein n=2 Tax=Pseudomonas tolaasii TaxID=29442 RepID=A0A7Y8AJB0_PSETO|nr:hypothetical protein [Pseudomonas tolaasii]ARB30195.1 hypothetical protein B5P22_23860 [Pseudomonas tolaasii]KAB0466404.1 hypothetical protein F7R12_28255 [Pseudomonas tolaasii]MBY8941952.1 hypothetical protein [Pseudomonas tolaasii]NWC23896.1 hypothetical protein [Pseudomonas tolaasii]NWC41693.1 hypothetical protein [Pseudomonas tolaasii]